MDKEIKSSRITKYPIGEIVLTPQEMLLLWRRRKQWNQKKAAEHYNVPYVTYNFAESGKAKNFKYKKMNLLPLKDHEKCFILRRRAGKTQEEIATQIGCGVYWLRLQELGKVKAPKLVAHWGIQKQNKRDNKNDSAKNGSLS